MPKDNEVDEKVKDFFERLYGMTFRLFLDPNSEEDEGNTVELRLGATVDNLALFETQDHAVLHPAATVAELRAKADAAERRVRELEAALSRKDEIIRGLVSSPARNDHRSKGGHSGDQGDEPCTYGKFGSGE